MDISKYNLTLSQVQVNKIATINNIGSMASLKTIIDLLIRIISKIEQKDEVEIDSEVTEISEKYLDEIFHELYDKKFLDVD